MRKGSTAGWSGPQDRSEGGHQSTGVRNTELGGRMEKMDEGQQEFRGREERLYENPKNLFLARQ